MISIRYFLKSFKKILVSSSIIIFFLSFACATFKSPPFESKAEDKSDPIYEMQKLNAEQEVSLQEVELKLKDLEDRLAILSEKIEKARRQLESISIPAPPVIEKQDVYSLPAEVKPVQEPSLPSEKITKSATEIYNEAQELYFAQEYVEARQKFQNLLQVFPDSDLADNAQYWVGECFYAVKDYPAALSAFEIVTKNYPKGNKTPTALLKTGYIYVELKQFDKAKEVLEQVVKKYPWSQEAVSARDKLATLH